MAAIESGATGLTLINTVGPALAAVGCHPILSNRLGGLSGDGIRPMGLRAVEQVRKAVGTEPVIIGMGGIASPEHVQQYARAGADLFGIGSALTGLDSGQVQDYLAGLQRDVCAGGEGRGYERSCESTAAMEYFKTRVRSRVEYDESLFALVLEDLPASYGDGDLAGKFFFLCLPGIGEKPFAIFSASEKSIVVRTVGEFTAQLARLPAGAEILVRGPTDAACRRLKTRRSSSSRAEPESRRYWRSLSKLRPANRQVFLLGARTRAHLFDVEKFERLGPVRLATDDGSAGHHGYVPELLREVVAGLEKEQLVFINCGPEPMVRRCFDIQREIAPGDRIIASIEYMTSCGVGICGKCASPSGALTCVDGPFLPYPEFLFPGTVLRNPRNRSQADERP